MAEQQQRVAILFSGGNAMAAFHAGVCESLLGAGLDPDYVTGTSAGSVLAALIAGNRPESRLSAIREFWRRVTMPAPALPDWPQTRRVGGLFSGIAARLFTVPAVWRHRMPLSGEPRALYNLEPLEHTLEELVDWRLANGGAPRLRINAVDADTGAEAIFDNAETTITACHVTASAALPPDFEPVACDGHSYLDGSLAANAVLPDDDWLFAGGDTVLLLSDLFDPAAARPPTTIDALIQRRQDVVYSLQLDRLLDILRLKAELRARDGWTGSIAVLRLVQPTRPQDHSQKTYDFSMQTVADRIQLGQAAADEALARLRIMAMQPGTVRVDRLVAREAAPTPP